MTEQKIKKATEKKPKKREKYNKMKNSVSNLFAQNKKSETIFRFQSDKNPVKPWFWQKIG